MGLGVAARWVRPRQAPSPPSQQLSGGGDRAGGDAGHGAKRKCVCVCVCVCVCEARAAGVGRISPILSWVGSAGSWVRKRRRWCLSCAWTECWAELRGRQQSQGVVSPGGLAVLAAVGRRSLDGSWQLYTPAGSRDSGNSPWSSGPHYQVMVARLVVVGLVWVGGPHHHCLHQPEWDSSQLDAGTARGTSKPTETVSHGKSPRIRYSVFGIRALGSVQALFLSRCRGPSCRRRAVLGSMCSAWVGPLLPSFLARSSALAVGLRDACLGDPAFVSLRWIVTPPSLLPPCQSACLLPLRSVSWVAVWGSIWGRLCSSARWDSARWLCCSGCWIWGVAVLLVPLLWMVGVVLRDLGPSSVLWAVLCARCDACAGTWDAVAVLAEFWPFVRSGR